MPGGASPKRIGGKTVHDGCSKAGAANPILVRSRRDSGRTKNVAQGEEHERTANIP